LPSKKYLLHAPLVLQWPKSEQMRLQQQLPLYRTCFIVGADFTTFFGQRQPMADFCNLLLNFLLSPPKWLLYPRFLSAQIYAFFMDFLQISTISMDSIHMKFEHQATSLRPTCTICSWMICRDGHWKLGRSLQHWKAAVELIFGQMPPGSVICYIRFFCFVQFVVFSDLVTSLEELLCVHITIQLLTKILNIMHVQLTNLSV